MIVARRGDCRAQNTLIAVYRRDDAGKHEHKERVVFGIGSGVEQIQPRVGRKRPVVMLARTVHSLKRLFVQKADEVVLFRHLFHQLHRKLVVVYGDVGSRENGRKLVLRGRDLVVLGFGVDAVTPKRFVQIAHIIGNARF